jgi:gliding motility-associated-like protein
MFFKTPFIAFLLVIFSTISIHAQILEINKDGEATSLYTPQELIKEILISGDCANVSNFDSQTNGSASDNRGKSYGFFNKLPGSPFPFEQGVVLTSGIAYDAGNTSNFSDLSHTDINWGGDSDLANALAITEPLQNATFIEFDFVPSSSEISFRYLMASEEYQGTFPCAFSDSFAFLLKKQGDPLYQNLAVIPETTIPVSVVNVHPEIIDGCAAENETYFAGYNMGDTNYDGRTTVLTARATVVPNEVYHIKLVVADASDDQFDTAVFLEAGSFNLGLDLGSDFLKTTNSAACGSAQLLESNIASTSYTWYKDNVVIPGENSKTYLADLGDGTYKLEINNGASCVASDEVFIEFVTAPTIAVTIAPFNSCDDNNDGKVFYDLTEKDTEILAGQPDTMFEVVYFSDSLYQNRITTSSNFELSSSSSTVYVQVRNKESTNCVASSQFTISKYEVPLVSAPTDYEVCDDVASGTDIDGKYVGFDLGSKNLEIVASADLAKVNFSYYRSLSEATSKSNPISNSSNYTNETANLQPIIVRIEDVNNADCFKTVSFNLVVYALPTVVSTTLKQCDDDTDGYAAFNLTEANTKISSNAANETFIYYKNSTDAASEFDPISNPIAYTNITQTTDKVWVVIKSNKLCSRVATIDLTVSTTAIAPSFQRTFEVCDDFLDTNGNDNANNNDIDGIATFDFSSVTSEITSLFPTSQQLVIAYYRNEADALAENNKINDPSNYRNIGYPNTQNIYVRVDSKLDNDCLGLGHHITLNVLPIPTVQNPPDMSMCDNDDDGDGYNGLVGGFDLESQKSNLLGTLPPNDYKVTYHLSPTEAENGANPQASPFINTVKDQQTIYVRVENELTGCINPYKSFDLIVNPLPKVNTVTPLEICDDESDGSAFTGFSQSINLTDKVDEILGPDQPLSDFDVTFHSSLPHAENGLFPLSSPFTNTVAFQQTIYVRIQEKLTPDNCFTTNQFDVLVHPEPISNKIISIALCDDNSYGDDTNGIVQNFNLDSYIDTVLGNTQSKTDFDVTFHETQTDAATGFNSIASPYTNIVSETQTIYVRVFNKTTECVNDSETIELTVNPLPDFEVDSPQILCINDAPKEIAINRFSENYTYSWYDPSGLLIGNVEKTYVYSGGNYTVTAQKTDGTGCERTLVVEVNESSLSTLTSDEIEIIDDTSNNIINIDTENIGKGDYEFALEDSNSTIIRNYQDSPTFGNLLGGIYTVLVRDKNGCGSVRVKVSVISFPKYFTPNNDGYHDTWSVRGVDLDFYARSTLYIFNRFGKLLKTLNPTVDSWDGTYLGKPLPSDDYWFSIELVNLDGEIRQRNGHFSLKR